MPIMSKWCGLSERPRHPDDRPGQDSGNRHGQHVVQDRLQVGEAPTASAASRIDGRHGDASAVPGLAMMIVGRVIRARTMPPTSGAERGSPIRS